MLVGVGGSGRHSLTRLALRIAEYENYEIEITRGFNLDLFRECIKNDLFRPCGCKNKNIGFTFSDNQIVYESFIEDINNILSSGEVPNLFLPDELGEIKDEVRNDSKAAGYGDTPDKLMEFFFDRIRTNLSIILCMSPIGKDLFSYCRMYPSLVNCCTINWFLTWPYEALKEVAQ